MRIAILGTGALATVYGVYLHHAGHDVTVIGRGASLNGVRAHGLRLRETDGGEADAGVTALDAQEAAAADLAPDFLLVCTKAIDTAGQLRPLAPITPGAVLSIQNGLQKDEFLREVFPDSDLVGAATLISATRRPDGSAVLVNRSTTLLAPDHNPTAARLAAALEAAGLPASLVADRETLLWSKASYVSAGFGVSILTRLDIGSVLSTPPLRELFLDLFRESSQVAAARGLRLDDHPGLPARSLAEFPRDEALALLANMGSRIVSASLPLRVSMLQDLDAGRPTEAREVLGPLTDAARAAHLSVPLLETAYRVVSGLDAIGHSSTGSSGPTASSTA